MLYSFLLLWCFGDAFIDLQGDANVGGMLSDGMKWLLALIPLTATHADADWPPIVVVPPPTGRTPRLSGNDLPGLLGEQCCGALRRRHVCFR